MTRRVEWTVELFAENSTLDSNGCWLWDRAVDRDGYGIGGHGRSHRLAYVAAYGPIPEGMTVDHICFTRRCVNPEHLRLLTHAENARRQRSAEKTHCKNGHPFSPENTYMRTVDSEGRRQCRTCNREAVRRYRQRRSA